jgi:hypothetical protein
MSEKGNGKRTQSSKRRLEKLMEEIAGSTNI